MRVILGLGGLFGAGLCLWGVIDCLNIAGGTVAIGVPGGFPEMIMGAAAVAKLWAGAVLMVLADGLQGLISLGRDMRERHPGVPPPGLLERLFGKKDGD